MKTPTKTLPKTTRKPYVPHMVCVDGAGAPRCIHESEIDAVNEAKRLAANNPNRLVRVLKITKQFRGDVNVGPVALDAPEECIPF